MPIWGTRLRERASNDPDFPIAEAEGYTQIRILALIEYIASLQEQ
jgi:hypothetical protein